jgi:hypothetical protein
MRMKIKCGSPVIMHELTRVTLIVCLWSVLVSQFRFDLFGLDSFGIPEAQLTECLPIQRHMTYEVEKASLHKLITNADFIQVLFRISLSKCLLVQVFIFVDVDITE